MKKTLGEQIQEAVREKIMLGNQISDQEVERLIDEEILEESRHQYISLKEKQQIRQHVFHALRGLDCLEEILADQEITEIMINGPKQIYVEKKGQIKQWEGEFTSEEKLMDVVQKVVSNCNRMVNESSPIVDARLKDGSRVNVVLPPIALDGIAMTIRRFPKETYSMEDLYTMGMLSREMLDFLKLLIKGRYNIMISGGTGSGKTTFLNALSQYIPREERVVTIEDSAELKLKHQENLVRLEVRNENTEGQNSVTMKELIRSSLRMRPDRIIVGEVRGPEALEMIHAMNTGHDGSLSTGHANSAKDMLLRLEPMLLAAVDMPVLALRQQIQSAIDIVIHIGRLSDGTRRVMEIIELVKLQGGEIQTNTLYQYVLEDGQEQIKGSWQRKGELIHAEKMVEHGLGRDMVKLYKRGGDLKSVGDCGNMYSARVAML